MKQPTSAQQEQLVFHPHNIMLALLLFGLSALFLAFTAAYSYIRVAMKVPPVQVPWLFWLNTLLLLWSSYTIYRAKKSYLADKTEAYQRSLLLTICISALFLCMQVLAWVLLFKMNRIALSSSTTAGFLYVVSFTHFIHVVAGLPFLFLFYRAARRQMVDPVTVLIYFSDPAKRLKLRLLSIYWHFLDIVWIYLVVFLSINCWLPV